MMSYISSCFDILFPPTKEALLVRSLTNDTLRTCYKPIKIASTNPKTIALLDYDDTRVKALIHQAKFSRDKKAWVCLGEIFSLFLSEEKFSGNALIVPVPLHKKRYRIRGYNQVLEVLKRVELPPHAHVRSDILQKKYALKSQVEKDRDARRDLPEDLFYVQCKENESLGTVTIFIVDDVITTGTTLARAIYAFQDVGARDIRPVALSYKR